ncbi:zinc-dependent alcohol dehydrogenase [Flavisphingomonas formosensis]|uniref:zinc-dependent alcohol dehydrogenase n=1 Tax=Flavisphingomonas formosensis TaxID=861534 RepID=UPI0012FCA61C|nr:alcohol dehydrogenase catalytic domain-containing protein [Sphingomonas formosensis]
MKAVRCAEGHVHVAEVERPSGEGVRVRIASAGICGSDLHLLAAGYPITANLGHEMAGIAENGQAVAIEPLAVCGECPACAAGAYHHCALGAFAITLGLGRDGGMAEEVIVPERCLVPLPAGLSAKDACLAEPIAVAVHGIARAGVRPGDRLAVVGGGSIGLSAVAVARGMGLPVALAARHDAQRLAGERLGATADPAGEHEVVIDCAGTSESIAQAVRLARTGGTVLTLATYWGGLELPAFEVAAKELKIVASSSYARNGAVRDIDIAASLLAGNPRIAETIISHRLPLEAASEAFDLARDRTSGAIKVVLEP